MKGIVGVYSKDNVGLKGLYNLYGVQHRGQESSGMTVAGDHSLRTLRGKGLVSNIFNENFHSFIHPIDYVAIGAASGDNSDNPNVVPPLELDTEDYKISLTLDSHLSLDGVDEGLFAFLMGAHLVENPIDEALVETMKQLDYAYYSLVAAVYHKNGGGTDLYAARDRRGVRPLYMAMNNEEVFIASESSPIDVLENIGVEITEREDVVPGSLIKINSDGIKKEQVMPPKRAHCVFEWVYFGRPDSVIEGKSVYNVRKRLGHELVKTHDIQPEPDITIIPVPDSGRSVCAGVAEALHIPADEGVIKNAYLGRTYIINDPEYRKLASDLKHNIIKETVKGKRILITDDSIVRGTVSESVAKSLRKAGAKEVEFLVSYAPIFYPCHSDYEDKPLAAKPYKGKTLFQIGDLVASNLPSIDKVRYNSVENVIKSVGLPEDHLCTMCITGKDPFEEI